MPLIKQQISSDLKPIFKKWSKQAFKDMYSLEFSNELTIDEMQNLMADKFSDTFSEISNELATVIITTLTSADVITNTGTGKIS